MNSTHGVNESGYMSDEHERTRGKLRTLLSGASRTLCDWELAPDGTPDLRARTLETEELCATANELQTMMTQQAKPARVRCAIADRIVLI